MTTTPMTTAAANGGPAARQQAPLLSVRNVVQEFETRRAGGIKGGIVHAVSNVSFDVLPGETVGVVGETGSGKSTLARSVIQAPPPKSGQVIFEGVDLCTLKGSKLKQARRQMQMVYQDPFGSLNPRWRIEDLVAEPMLGYRIGGGRESRDKRISELLDLVGLDPSIYRRRRPIELSGGQCQRVAIARAIALNPALIICDEAVSSLDVLIQAQVLNLFEKLRRELNLSYLFIAHDLSLVKQVSDRVAVMHLGQLAEIGPVESLYARPLHPYTAALLNSVPGFDPQTGQARKPVPLKGEPPSPLDPPSGCRFRTRCPRAQETCALVEPRLRERSPGHEVACHFPLDEPAPGSGEAPAAAAAVLSGEPASVPGADADRAAKPDGQPPTLTRTAP
ncbi:MAG: ABC transporter ATP-binding protein [Frankia sp.]|nr:ABC transporter ATP-binding protein [Frankia sp.]